MLLYILTIISTTTDLLENLIQIGGFYLSPVRIYIALSLYLLILILLGKGVLDIKLGRIFRIFSVISMVFIGIVTLSIMNSPEILYSIKRTLNVLSLFMVVYLSYLFARTQKFNINTFLNIWLIISLVICIVGSFQLFFDFKIGSEELETRRLIFLEITRINSLFKDPNFFGYFLISFFFLSIIYPYTKNNFVFKPFLILTSLVFLILTGSRGAMIAVVGGCIFMTALKYFKPKKLVLGIFCIGVICSLSLYYLNFDALLSKIMTIDIEEKTFYSRMLIWYSGFQLIFDNPLLGVGPGNFIHSEKGQFLEGIWEEQKDVISGMAGHSNYLEIAAESGIVALIAYLTILVFVLISINKAIKMCKDNTTSSALKWIFYSLISMMIANVSLSYYPFYMFVLMGVGIYLAEQVTKNNAENN